MVIKEFKLLKELPPGGPFGAYSAQTYFARVTVVTEYFLWESTVRRIVFKSGEEGRWYFLDTGEEAPHETLNKLARAYKAQQAFYAE